MKAAMQNLLSLPLFKGLASDELDTILGKVNALVKHFEKMSQPLQDLHG